MTSRPTYRKMTDIHRLPNGAIEGAANSGAAQFHTPPPVYDAMELISREQRRYADEHATRRQYPTRFDVQNQALAIGGSALPMHAPILGRDPRTPYDPQSYFAAIPRQPQRPLGDSSSFENPGPYDFAEAVRSQPPTELYAYPVDALARMVRSPDEVDPGLVTQPLPDTTFMARLPQFNHVAEELETDRLRSENVGRMRLW